MTSINNILDDRQRKQTFQLLGVLLVEQMVKAFMCFLKGNNYLRFQILWFMSFRHSFSSFDPEQRAESRYIVVGA